MLLSVHDKRCQQRPVKLCRKGADDSAAATLTAVRITGLSQTSWPEPEQGWAEALKGQAILHSLYLLSFLLLLPSDVS